MASFFVDQYPQLTEANTNAINALYPLVTPNPFLGHAPFFASLEAAYGEATFTCPGITMTTLISQSQPAYLYRYDFCSYLSCH